ncbi:hypothetical protein BJY00DRAFT_194764 [Aspergillus carlsbadensis]|nr:hypothetical protein BJY00DRAFT_194764 [Aspergillus carlsbadensis]
MAPTPNPRQRWFLSKSPAEKPAEPTPPSNEKRNTNNTKSPTSNPGPSTTAPKLLRDLYTSLETSYNPLLTIICNHAFIKEARYPVRQSARIRFVRDVYYEAGLLGYSDEVVRRVLVDVKRFFLERVGRVDVFDEEGAGFGEEVDDLAGFDVVVGDGFEDGGVEDDIGDGVQDGVQDEDEDGWETESESKVSGVDDAVDEFERAVGSVESASQMLRDIAAALGGSPRHLSPESPCDKVRGQAKSAKSEKKRKRKHKQSRGEEIVEAVEAALGEIDKPIGMRTPPIALIYPLPYLLMYPDNHEEVLTGPIVSQAKSLKHEKRKRTGSLGEESMEFAPCESEKALGMQSHPMALMSHLSPPPLPTLPDDHDEQPADLAESQAKPVKLSKSQKKRKRKRSYDQGSADVSRETCELLGDHGEASMNPVECQIKPVQREKKRMPIDEQPLKMPVETDMPLDDFKATSTDPVKTNAKTNQPLVDDKSHAATRRARKHKKNHRDKFKAKNSSSKGASTKFNTPKQGRDKTSVLDF